MPPFAGPKATSGKIILNANITAKPGKGDELQAAIAAVRASAESTLEPNTLTYRTTRAEANPDHFMIYEEYILPDGLEEHTSADAFKKLAASDFIDKLDIQYFKEFQ